MREREREADRYENLIAFHSSGIRRAHSMFLVSVAMQRSLQSAISPTDKLLWLLWAWGIYKVPLIYNNTLRTFAIML